MKYSFAFRTKFLKEYDTVIFSGNCIEAIRNIRSDTKIIFYCHTPPRYLFDQEKDYKKKIPLLLRPIYSIVILLMRHAWICNVQKIIAH